MVVIEVEEEVLVKVVMEVEEAVKVGCGGRRGGGGGS